MLLVDDSQAEVVELHLIFYNGMRSHSNVNGTVDESVHYFLALLALYDACEQLYAYVHTP